MTSTPLPSAPAAAPPADPALKAAVLAEYLPYLRPYAGRTIVVGAPADEYSRTNRSARNLLFS